MDDTPENTTPQDTQSDATQNETNKPNEPSEEAEALATADKDKETYTLDLDELDKSFEAPIEPDGKSEQGLAAILNSGKIHSERLPILDVVFDRLVRLLSTSLRNFTSDNVDVSCSKISALRFSDYLNSVSLPALLGVFKADPWDTNALISIDNPLIYSVIDSLLGGRKSSKANQRNDIRPYTTIERNLVERLINIILEDFKEAFSPVCDVNFNFERLESNPRFASIVRETNVTMKVTFKIKMEDRGGSFDIAIPYSSIEPVRDLLLQKFMGEKFGRDHIWEIHFTDRIRDANLNLEAILPTEKFALREVLAWKEGSYVQLSSTTQSQVHVISENYELLLGKMGQKNGHIAIKVNDILFGKNGETQ